MPAIAIKLYHAALPLARSAAIFLTIRDGAATSVTLTRLRLFIIGH